MLAKIGHAYAVWKLGLDGLDPIALNPIEGESPMRTSLLVGCEQHDAPPTRERHSVAHEWRAGPDGKDYLVVKVRLFSHLGGTPTNLVVVGCRPTIVAVDQVQPSH